MHLPDPNDAQHGEQALELEMRAGLLDGLARCALLDGLAQFHEACGECPQAVARLDIAPAQQHLVAPYRHRADHVQRVLVVDRVANGAGRALAVVVRRHRVNRGAAAGLAVLDAVGCEHRARV